MKSLLKEGGVFAFPFAITETPFCPGMTLRDYFAAKALECVIGLISDNDQAAQEAYKIADAMIAARSQK